jgi:hypothetical protein
MAIRQERELPQFGTNLTLIYLDDVKSPRNDAQEGDHTFLRERT